MICSYVGEVLREGCLEVTIHRESSFGRSGSHTQVEAVTYGYAHFHSHLVYPRSFPDIYKVALKLLDRRYFGNEKLVLEQIKALQISACDQLRSAPTMEQQHTLVTLWANHQSTDTSVHEAGLHFVHAFITTPPEIIAGNVDRPTRRGLGDTQSRAIHWTVDLQLVGAHLVPSDSVLRILLKWRAGYCTFHETKELVGLYR